MHGYIYVIRNIVNNKIYIGQTRTSIEQRWQEHVRHSNYGNQLINRAMKKYGIENFCIEELECCDISDLDYKEIYYIKKFNSTNKDIGYNVSLGGLTPKFESKEIDIDNVVDLYINKKLTLQEISNKLNISRYLLTSALRNNKIKLRTRWDSASKFNKLSESKIKDAIEISKSLRGAAKYLEIPYNTFRKACIYYNIEYNSSKSIRH